jgi:hypothetical protein
MHGSSNQGYTKPAFASNEICSAPGTACQSATELRAAQEYLPARKVYWNTRSGRPWSVFLYDAMPAEFPSDKPQQSQRLSSASAYTRQNCGLAGYLLQLLGLSRSQWPRGLLRRGSVAARLLRLWVRIPPCLLGVLCVVR